MTLTMAERKVVLLLMVFLFGTLRASCISKHDCVKFETQPIITDGPNKILNFTLNICNKDRYSLKGVDVEVKSLAGSILLCALNVGPDAYVKSDACSCDHLYLHGLSKCSVTRKNAIGSETWHLTAILQNEERVRHCPLKSLEIPFTESNTKITEATEVRKLTRKPTSPSVPAWESAPTDYYWQPTETPSNAIVTEKGTDNKQLMYIGFGCLGAVVLIAIVCGSVVVHRKRTGHGASRANRAQLDAIQMRPLPVLPAVPVVQDNRDSVLTETDDTYTRVNDDNITGPSTSHPRPLFKTDADGYLCPKTTAMSSREAMLARTSAESRGESGEGGYLPLF